jgi:N-acetylglucosaminyldiphosphoundecaprenol N-acetyl-beta-D-mannosaminyltransferase
MPTTTQAPAVTPLDLPPRINLLGVGIHSVNLESAVSAMEAAVLASRHSYVCVTNVHGVMEAQSNPRLQRAINGAWLTVPDGRPSVWIGRAQGQAQMDQVGGPDLILRFCELSSRRGYTQFLYGGAPGVAEQLKNELCRRYPGLNVVGTYTPPFRPLTEKEEAELQKLMTLTKPDVTWIGLGTPKQELFMAQYLGRLDTTLMVGVGAAFDMHTGKIKDAPAWVKRVGLAWLHRLLQEPRRLWRRYLKSNPAFCLAIALQLLRVKKYHLPLST